MASLNGSSNDHSRPLKRSRVARDEHSGNNVVLDNSSVVVRKMVWNNTNPPNAPSLDLNTNDSNALFEALIHPLSRHDFLSCYFRKCAVHTTSNTSTNNTIIDGNDTNRLEPLLEAMNHLDPARILQDTSSENIFVWLLHQNEIDDDENNDRSKRMIQSIEVDTVETAIALYKAGHATYCRTSPHVEQVLVRHVLRATGMGCGQYNAHNEQATLGRGEVEVFMTPNNHHTTDWHFDFQENFTLQLSGSKKWYLLKGVVDHPLRACTPHYAAPEAVESQLKAAHLSHPRFEFGKPKVGVNAQGSVEEVLMRPGDVLYHPAGIWHKVEVLEPGVSINISLMATNYATITCQALQHFLMKKMAWRETLVSNGSPDQVREQLGGLLQHVLLDDVQDFIAQCGASAIVPPVLSRAVDPDCLQTGGGPGWPIR